MQHAGIMPQLEQVLCRVMQRMGAAKGCKALEWSVTCNAPEGSVTPQRCWDLKTSNPPQPSTMVIHIKHSRTVQHLLTGPL
jgi:hypothetical protein